MNPITPEFLLSHPDLVLPVAPWCAWMDRFQLCTAMLLQPWVAGRGLRRAELERQMQVIGRDLWIGPLYFQRVHRSVKDMQANGVVRTSGSGRARMYQLTPEGFLALAFNVQTFRTDPGQDNREYEFKRELASLWNLTLSRALAVLHPAESGIRLDRFFDRLEQIRIWNQPVLIPELVNKAVDIGHILRLQRERVISFRRQALQRLNREQHLGQALQELGDADALGITGHDLRAVTSWIRASATGMLPPISLKARIARYDGYLAYLDSLVQVYTGKLPAFEFVSFKERMLA